MDVISEFIDAISTYDVERLRPLLADEFVHWVSLTEQEQGAAELLALMAREREVVASATFELRHRVSTDEGAVALVTVDGTTKSGADFHIPVCLVMAVTDGKVVRLDEYANTERARQLIRDIFAG